MQATLRFVKLVFGFSLLALGLRYFRQSELPDSAVNALFIGIGLTVLWTDWRKT